MSFRDINFSNEELKILEHKSSGNIPSGFLSDDDQEKIELLFNIQIYHRPSDMKDLAIIYGHKSKNDRDRWLIEASKRRNREATNKLLNVLDGYTLKLDFGYAERAFEMLNIVSEFNRYHRILDFLGEMYYRGIGTPKNIVVAYEYFEEAAKYGNENSMCKMGEKFENEGDYQKAAELYSQASKNNNFPYAICRIAHMFLWGVGLPRPDYIKAYNLYRSVSNSGSASYHLGLMLDGFFQNDPEQYPFFPTDKIPTNRSEAFRYFKIGANKKHRLSCYKLGRFYENEPGHNDLVSKNLKQALKYYLMGAIKYDGDCCFKVGQFYENYPGYDGVVLQDIEKAYFFYQRGASYQNQECIEKLAQMYLE